jgi:DNA-binding SARP family transcriptional activator
MPAGHGFVMVRSWSAVVGEGYHHGLVEVQLLGPLAVTVDGSTVPIRGAKERAVLSLLALRAGSAVSMGELVDSLWGSSPPPSALRGLHNYVANLRWVLPAGLVVTVPGGYRADLAPDAVDVFRFERAVVAARRTADAATAAAILGEALGWWRGPPLPDLAASSVGAAEATRFNELRAAAQEDLFQARLAQGEHTALVADLEAAVSVEPLRAALGSAHDGFIPLRPPGRRPARLSAAAKHPG